MLLEGIGNYRSDKINLCPNCKGRHDTYAQPGEPQAPEPGDITICQYCLTVLEFTEGMELVIADMEKLVKEDPGIIQELEAARRAAIEDRELKQREKN